MELIGSVPGQLKNKTRQKGENMKLWKGILLIIGIGIFVLATGTSGRTEILEKSDHWKNFFAVYGWPQSIKGDFKVKGVDTNVDVPFSDIVDKIRFCFMGHYEGFKGHWGVWLDVSYAQLETSSEHPGGPLPGKRQFKANQGVVELAIPYRFAWNPVVADVFVGGRYSGMYTEVGIPSLALKTDSTVQWVDPFVGARVFIPLSKQWYLGLRGDIGGFGIGNSSDLALNGSISINWQINHLISLHAGYRAYYLKYTLGEVEWNATQYGPWLGLGFTF
jgi:hypothetical protein